MKKFLFMGALAAMLLGTASCADENMFGNDGNVCFEIELPGAIESRTISDGETATALTVAVYDENGAELPQLRQTATLSGKKGTVTFNLVRGKKYSFAFWAQDPNAKCYKFNTSNGEVSIDYDDIDNAGICNDEKRDAFYAYREPQRIDGTITETIKLYRPFAQLNYIATDYAEAVAAGYDVNKSSVTVKNAATSFNLKTGQAGETTTPVTFTLNDRPAEAPTFLKAPEGTTYTWMAMNYFIVPNNEAMIETSLTLNEGETPVVESMAVNNVPVKKNHRTNIIGAFMTTQAIFNIEVIPFYDEADYDIVNGVLMLKSKMTADEINYLFKNRSGAYALAEDLDIDDQLVVPAGITATLNLNGHNIINSSDIWNGPSWSLISVQGGDLTINGNGQVIAKENDCYALDVRNGGNLVVNGGDYNGNVTAVYAHTGHVKINGGSFTIQQVMTSGDPYRFTLNLLDANGKNGTASIEVAGGKYYKFDPSNNLAENPQVNFVAAGYETVQNGEWYEVKEITPLTDINAIKEAVQVPGKTVVVASNVMLEIDPATIANDVTLLGKEGATLKLLNNRRFNNNNITVQGFKISNSGISGSNLNIYSNNFTLKDCSFVGSENSVDEITIFGGDASGLITIENCNLTDKNVFKAIHIFGKSTVKIKNSVIDATYPFNCNGSNCDVIVEDSKLLGWTSYNNGTGHKTTFENCQFGRGTSGYAYLRPYNTTNINNCKFSSDFRINPVAQSTVTITNSTWLDGSAVDVTLIDWSEGTSGSPNSPTNTDGSTVSIDGVYVHP